MSSTVTVLVILTAFVLLNVLAVLFGADSRTSDDWKYQR